MNQKITFPELVNALSEATQTSKKISEEFLKEFFSLIADTLTSGENVKIKRLGTFKVIDVEQRKSINVNTGEEIIIPQHRKITFTPDKELADAVNLPFSAFEAVEIADDVTDEMLSSVDNDTLPQENQIENSSETENQHQEAASDKDSIDSMQELPQIEWDDNSYEEEIVETQQKEGEDIEKNKSEEMVCDTEETESNEYDENEQSKTAKKTFLKGFFVGVVSLLLLLLASSAIIYFVFPKESTRLVENMNQYVSEALVANNEQLTNNVIDTVKVDSISTWTDDDSQTVNTAPSDQPIYDTISRTRFLTTMAKEHYGNFNLWPYIYEENKDILGHPDRIKPGTKVEIPPMSKYGINPNNEDCIEKAKQKGTEIYNRYKK